MSTYHRAAAVIDSVRAIFRKGALNRTSFDVNDLVREALALVRADLQEHRILVNAEADAQLPPVSGDRIQLQQVLLNLITNAIDSMAAKDRPRVLRVRSGVHDDGNVLVSIGDTGIGIDQQDVDRIFNPLFTTIWVVPNTPQGAVFHVSLLADGAASAGALQGEQSRRNAPW